MMIQDIFVLSDLGNLGNFWRKIENCRNNYFENDFIHWNTDKNYARVHFYVEGLFTLENPDFSSQIRIFKDRVIRAISSFKYCAFYGRSPSPNTDAIQRNCNLTARWPIEPNYVCIWRWGWSIKCASIFCHFGVKIHVFW